MWRGSVMNFSTNTRSSPNEDFASERARAKPSATSALEWAIRMPLPPPPAEAFIMTGKPISCAILTACFSSSITPRKPGTVETLAFAAAFFDSILSPIAAIAFGFGPMKTMPAAASALGKASRSDRKP